ncbi:MAG TPA: bifunctional phosphoribosylaminoimidazolecarboxamide formyltransferase/IMP cyclohydrolase [Actinomycetota bacterium]|nr:bifunctional phosphoribosylaminoimidazolecarboxamide formyltransferase/IMP cyclohydrolase [Actinomycetota bacterium]
MTDVLPVRRALISVADKTGLVEFARRLVERGVALVSSGSTAGALQQATLPVTPVSDVTGFPELMGGRVKTLHPRIHGGILADKSNPTHLEELRAHGIEPFDLVVVNLYPFRETVASGASAEDVIEQIDIGGPALIRAAAKNHRSVAVLVTPSSYQSILDELDRGGGVSVETRRRLAAEAFEHTGAYDAAIAAWFKDADRTEDEQLPARILIGLVRQADELRYGENPHQRAALYWREGAGSLLGGATVLQGKEMSFNNWLDAEAARSVAWSFDRPAAAIIKHNNPCGVAVADTVAEAYRKALESDRVSAYGGIVAFNREVDAEVAKALEGIFTEVVVAPRFASGARDVLSKKQNLRLLTAPSPGLERLDVRLVEGGALVQDADTVTESLGDMKVVTEREPTPGQWEDLLFAWTVAARVKSNAIVLASDLATVGVGAGQMNRLYSVDIAVRHAGERARGACLASDAFFPFRDGVDRAGDAGVGAVIQPGGSVRDDEVIAAANEHGIAMVFTGRRHFRH